MSKKFITTIAVLLIATLMSVTSAHAATKVTYSETSNGKIKTTLSFDDGFIGGVDVTFKISSNIKVKQFEFDSKISKSKYTKEYNYKDNTLTVIIASGGVGTDYNLLNDKKELTLGNIVFETSSKKDVKYSVECTKLTVVDNSWASKKIDIDKSSSNKDFSYKVTTIENQTGGSSSSSTGSSTGSSGSSSKGSGSSSDKSSDNKASANKDNSDKNTTDEEEKIDEETSLEEDLNSNISDSTIISDSTTTNQSTSTLEEETDTKKLNLGLIIGGTLGGVALLSGACFAVVKNKRY